MTTVLECLMNAQANFETIGRSGLDRNPIYAMALEQLQNGVEALQNGMAPRDALQQHAFGEVKLKPD